MTVRTCQVVAGLTIVFVLSTSGRASSSDDHSRPLVVTFGGFVGPTPTSDPCILVNNEHGEGKGTHLGAISWELEETVDLCSNPDGADVNGQIVLTAADGDQLFANYVTLAHLDFAANQFTASGTYRITGGTGRFASAGGTGVIAATGILSPPFDVAGGMSGTIRY